MMNGVSTTSAPASSRGAKLDPRTGRYAAIGHRRWLVQAQGRELRLVETEADLRELLRDGRVAQSTKVYEVGAGPQALGDVPELARILLETPPPILRLDEELAILDRNAEYEVEYYDRVPSIRWPRWIAFFAIFFAIGAGGYLLLAPRLATLTPRLQALAPRLMAPFITPSTPTPPPAPAPAAAAAVVEPPPPTPAPVAAAALPTPEPPAASASSQRPSEPTARAKRKLSTKKHPRHTARRR